MITEKMEMDHARVIDSLSAQKSNTTVITANIMINISKKDIYEARS